MLYIECGYRIFILAPVSNNTHPKRMLYISLAENFRMLSKIFHTIFFLIVFTDLSNAHAPSIQWQYCYDSPGNNDPSSIEQTSDNGYIMCGQTGNSPADQRLWVVKLDEAGTLTWQKDLFGPGRGIHIRQTTDGGYIVAAETTSNVGAFFNTNHGGSDWWILKLNSSGDVVWQKLFGGSGNEYVHRIEQTTDGGYIIAGQTFSSDGNITATHGQSEGWIVKLDAAGTISWQQCYGGSNFEEVRGIKQTTDGGYIVGGSSNSADGDVINGSATTGRVWVFKLNAVGDIQWQKTYGGTAAVSAVDICITSDGNYAVGAICNQNGGDVTGAHGGGDYWIIKLDNSGNIIWQKALGGSSFDYLVCINPTVDAGIVAVGYSASTNGDVTGIHDGIDYWVVRLSSPGELLWQKALGGDHGDFGLFVSQTTDMGYIVAGYTNSSNNGDVGNNPTAPATNAGWVIKLAPDLVPVTLVDFNAIPKGQDVLCSWKTMQEQNSSHFIIERSDDAVHFNSVGRVTAAGNSILPNNYRFTDYNVLSTGKEYLYYRLKMADIDGSFKYSNTVKVKLKYLPALNIYPNPVTDQLNFSFVSPITTESTVTVFNEAGAKVFQQPVPVLKGNNTLQIAVNTLPAGNYILLLSAGKIYKQSFFRAGK